MCFQAAEILLTKALYHRAMNYVWNMAELKNTQTYVTSYIHDLVIPYHIQIYQVLSNLYVFSYLSLILHLAVDLLCHRWLLLPKVGWFHIHSSWSRELDMLLKNLYICRFISNFKNGYLSPMHSSTTLDNSLSHTHIAQISPPPQQ